MKPAERYDWIENYLRVHQWRQGTTRYTVDICDANFVTAYIETTKCTFKPMFYGADRCHQLGRDLSHMAKVRRLKRYRTGLGDMHSMGFPKWVWSYHLPKNPD